MEKLSIKQPKSIFAFPKFLETELMSKKNPENLQKLSIKLKICKDIKLKPVIVLEISDVTSFNKRLEMECYPNFLIEIIGR